MSDQATSSQKRKLEKTEQEKPQESDKSSMAEKSEKKQKIEGGAGGSSSKAEKKAEHELELVHAPGVPCKYDCKATHLGYRWQCKIKEPHDTKECKWGSAFYCGECIKESNDSKEECDGCGCEHFVEEDAEGLTSVILPGVPKHKNSKVKATLVRARVCEATLDALHEEHGEPKKCSNCEARVFGEWPKGECPDCNTEFDDDDDE